MKSLLLASTSCFIIAGIIFVVDFQSINARPMGLTTAGLTSTGFTAFAPINLRCAANTAITEVSTFSGVSITYDVGGTIELLY